MPVRGIFLYRSTSDRTAIIIAQAILTFGIALCFGPFMAIPLVSFYFFLRLSPEWNRRVLKIEACEYSWPMHVVLFLFWFMSLLMLIYAVENHGKIGKWILWAWMGVFIIQFPLIIMEIRIAKKQKLILKNKLEDKIQEIEKRGPNKGRHRTIEMLSKKVSDLDV